MQTNAVVAVESGAMDGVHRALAHPERRELLRLVRSGEASVGELTAQLGRSQPIVSQQLRVLLDAELVGVRRDGNRRLYSINFEQFAALRDSLQDFWDVRLDALRAVAERPSSTDRPADSAASPGEQQHASR